MQIRSLSKHRQRDTDRVNESKQRVKIRTSYSGILSFPCVRTIKLYFLLLCGSSFCYQITGGVPGANGKKCRKRGSPCRKSLSPDNELKERRRIVPFFPFGSHLPSFSCFPPSPRVFQPLLWWIFINLLVQAVRIGIGIRRRVFCRFAASIPSPCLYAAFTFLAASSIPTHFATVVA